MPSSSRRTCYPKTAKLSNTICEELKRYHAQPRTLLSFCEVADAIVDTIGEYEHGTADTRDVAGVTLDQYIAVAEDLFLSIKAELEERH